MYYLIEIFAMQMHVDYHGLIYRKVLCLSSSCLNAFSSGEITNVFSNDASQIELILGSLNYLWSSPIDIIAMIVFCWYSVIRIDVK
ncbi:unnamed protein product [Rotaria sp. Silwood1]|nr:unnamed protein product [Rotaria sp. Silwood1]